MSLTLNGLVAVLGWTTLVLLVAGPGPLPFVALIVAIALLVGCVASLLLVGVWYGVVRRSLSSATSEEGWR
jgi:hypothetical protein